MAPRKFTFHLIGLVHLPTARKYTSCAFTQKNVKLAKMLVGLGHTVYLYGCRSSEEDFIEEYIFDGLYEIKSDGATCVSTHNSTAGKFYFIKTHTPEQIAAQWGEADNRFEIGYDWTNTDFRHDFNTERTGLTQDFNIKTANAVLLNSRKDHFLLCMQGSYHNEIADKVKLRLTCEPGIGYRGSVAGRFRAFESSYIQNFTYGSEHPFECINGSYYDRVIPNYFDPADVLFSNKKEDYYLFIGRMIKRKGIITAQLVCDAIGKKLIIAGQGARVDHRGHLVPITPPIDFDLPPGNWEYVGYVGTEKRKELMAHAIATFTPTEYLECFAGTHIESMLAGTPAITTNFAVFAETIPYHLNGIISYRCNTLQDFVDAALDAQIATLPVRIRHYATRYLMNRVAQEFERWFQDLYNVYESATQDGVKGWSRISSASIVAAHNSEPKEK